MCFHSLKVLTLATGSRIVKKQIVKELPYMMSMMKNHSLKVIMLATGSRSGKKQIVKELLYVKERAYHNLMSKKPFFATFANNDRTTLRYCTHIYEKQKVAITLSN